MQNILITCSSRCMYLRIKIYIPQGWNVIFNFKSFNYDEKFNWICLIGKVIQLTMSPLNMDSSNMTLKYPRKELSLSLTNSDFLIPISWQPDF